MKVKEITLKEAVKVSAVDTNTGNVTYKDDVTGVETTVPKGMATPTAQGQVQISAQQVAPGQPGAALAPTVKVGDQVKVVGQTGQTQTMGSMEEDGDELDTYGGEDDPDVDDDVAREVRYRAAELENRWGRMEDWSQDEVQAIASEVNMDPEAVADILELDVFGSDELDEIDDVEQVEQPYEDPQMEAIKRLAGL